MRSLLVSASIMLVFGYFTFFRNGPERHTFKPITFPPPTPCPSPAIPTNRVTACNPAPPPPTLEEIRESQERWAKEKRRLFDADYPLTSQTSVDVDGDGKKDTVFYRVQPWKDDFEGQLKITSAEGRTLWEDNFPMGSNDLAEFLTLLGYDSIKEWVRNVFNKKQNYSFQAETLKIKASEIDDDQLAYAAKVFKFSKSRIKGEILNQRVNRTYRYRAEWREDLVLLVYVPSIKRFFCYSRGY